MNETNGTRSEDHAQRQRDARRRLEKTDPALARLLTEARRRLAADSRGLSEEIEALAHTLVRVRTKVGRLPPARGQDLALLEAELEDGWAELERRAARVRGALGARDPAPDDPS